MPTMRKDLRVGLGIGGVLLAVLVVALIVRSHGKDKTKIAKIGGDTPAQTDPDGFGEPTPGEGAKDASPEGTPVAPGDFPKTKDPFDPEGGTTSATPGHGSTTGAPAPAAAGGSPDDWEKLLNASNPGPIHSVTPADGKSNARPGRAGRAGDKPAFPPGLVAKDRGPGGNDGNGNSPGSANGADSLKPTGSTTTGGGRSSPASGGTPRSHVIQKGETFASISRTVYGDGRYYLQIQKANPGLEPSALKPGTRINLPELASAGESRTASRSSHGAQSGSNGAASIDHKSQYKVESGDSLYKIAEKLYGDGTKMDSLYEANKQTIGPDPRKLKLGMILKLPEQPTVASAAR